MKHLIAITGVTFLLFSCGNQPEKEVVETQEEKAPTTLVLTDEQYKNTGIQLGKPEMKHISSTIKVNGKIDVPPQNMVSVSIPLGGYLKSTQLLPGMHISKGEVLAVMEDQQYIQLQQDFLTAKAQFSLVESEYERQKELNQNKATSDKVYEQANAAYQTQHILIKSLEQKLRLIGLNPDKITADNISRSINVYSPINGYVSAVNVNIGKYVNPSDVLFELVNPTDIHLNLSIFEKDLDKVAIGQKLFAYTNTNPEKKYVCEIILISKNVENDNAAEVHCHFEQYDKNLLPGMFMNAEIELTKNEVAALPEDAIVRYGNKHYVFVEKGDKTFEMTEIQIGGTENGFTEIINASASEKVVIKGAYTLLMALKNTEE
ncbi:MAG: efflux RND transporter periplasmic adaptor subunit [Tannerella sp.]|jgi:cobalt-zinc-cadmium efflux system membrane fusion protein|nr:efflux RND transporter periplasmic adaptor subunit [Tannerella sp.]